MTVAFICLGLFVATLVVGYKTSFRAQKSSDYAIMTPVFDIRDHLNGGMLCEGVIYGPFGRVTTRFVAQMHAEWQGNTGRMTEYFRYDNGNTQHREWTFTVSDDGKIQAKAPDLLGTGQGQQAGSAVILNYTIQLTKDAGGHALNVTDWMYLMENGTIMNRSQFRKFGIKVAELVATMRPMPIEESRSK
jgi:hypothetical protein